MGTAVPVNEFFENMAFIISLVYLGLKASGWTGEKFQGRRHLLIWLMPLYCSLVAMVVMARPFVYFGMRFDLRSVPIFVIAYFAGWKWAIVSAILPAFYRFSFSGQIFIGIAFGILLPVFIGGFFHHLYRISVLKTLNWRVFLGAFMMVRFVQGAVNFFALGMPVALWFEVTFFLTLFSMISVVGVALIISDEVRSTAHNRELYHKAFHDSLTGLLNLTAFKVAMGAGKSRPVFVAMVDLDHFKQYNDNFGHEAGNVILTGVSKILQEVLRANEDCVGCYGGEEFIVGFRDISEENALVALERIRATIAANLQVTVSIGLSGPGLSGEPLDILIEQADQALYVAKKNGRNRTVKYLSRTG